MDSLKAYLNDHGIITNRQAQALGYDRHTLSDLVKKGELKRLRPGVYQDKDAARDEFSFIASNSERIIFSHQTALYLHDLSDRTPGTFHITVPQGYNAVHIKKRYENLQVHYVKKERHELGRSEIRTPPGNRVAVYDMERTICDLIMDREKTDKQIFIDAMQRYFKASNKNVIRLIKYSRVFHIEEELRKYMEVLL